MIQGSEREFKWFNCVGCGKHLAKIIQPNGLIEIKFSHGKGRQFRILIHGSADYTCQHCGIHNVIAFLKYSQFKPINNNGKKYVQKQALEAAKSTNNNLSLKGR